MAGEGGLVDKQHYFQAQKAYVHLKGKHDRITSVIIPAAFVTISGFLMVRGLVHMARGTGKIEGT